MQKLNSNTTFAQQNDKHTCLSSHQHVMHNLCQVICISKNKKILLVGVMNDLIIMNFTQCNGQFKLLNKLRGHQGKINCIETFNSDNEIITAGNDGFINIWKKNQQWKLFQTLENNNNQVDQIIVNKTENLIISKDGGNIKFWNKQTDWQYPQHIQPFKGRYIYHIILNEKCNTLIASNTSICIIQLQSNNSWQIIQNFNVLDGERLFKFCFFKNDLLAIFPDYSREIIFYQQDQNQLFNKIKKITIQTQHIINWSFNPQQSINKEQLIVKMDKYILFLQINNNCDIISSHEIENDTLYFKEMIIEEIFLLINYYQIDYKKMRNFKIQKYKKF